MAIVGVGSAAGFAAGDDIAEGSRVDAARRTQPPIGSRDGRIMRIHHFAVSCRVIRILFKVVRFLCRGITSFSKYLIFP